MEYSEFNEDIKDEIKCKSNNIKYRFNYKDKDEINGFDPKTVTAENIFRNSFVLLQQPTKTRYDKLIKSLSENLGYNSEISKLFFSDENIKRIQKLLKKEINIKSNGKYSLVVDQDEKQLVYVMRAVFIEYARGIPNQIVRQVKLLNRKVIGEITPNVINSIVHNQGYLNRINNPVIPIDLPVNVNNRGRRTLPGFSTIWEF